MDALIEDVFDTHEVCKSNDGEEKCVRQLAFAESYDRTHCTSPSVAKSMIMTMTTMMVIKATTIVMTMMRVRSKQNKKQEGAVFRLS